jgi:hypothetical protein
MEEFSSAAPRNPGELGVEVLAQIRPNGRVLDHFRVTLGGSKILEVDVSLAKVLAGDETKSWRLRFQVWPKDLEIRRNMTTTIWLDVHDLVAANEAQVFEGENLLAPNVAARELKEKGIAYMFATMVGADERLMLQLQMLPASAATLMGRPTFRG